jgi:hypothetical protein
VEADCIECGFNIRLNDMKPVSCPFCSTINQPISSTPAANWLWVGVAVILGALLLKDED